MRQKIEKHRDLGGIMLVAIAAIILYSMWGAFLLDRNPSFTESSQQKELALQ